MFFLSVYNLKPAGKVIHRGDRIKRKSSLGPIVAGLCAGAINGLFGAGGGMILVPLLSVLTDLEEEEIFPASVSIILPICLVSLYIFTKDGGFTFMDALPYMFGSGIGGICAGILGKRIPTKWLHKLLGGFILWGGLRYLC